MKVSFLHLTCYIFFFFFCSKQVLFRILFMFFMSTSFMSLKIINLLFLQFLCDMENTCNHWKTVLEQFNGSNWICPPPFPPCSMLIGVTLSTSLLHLSTLFGGGWGGIWVEEGLKLHAHFCLKKHGLKLALAVRKTNTKMDRASQLLFSQIVDIERCSIILVWPHVMGTAPIHGNFQILQESVLKFKRKILNLTLAMRWIYFSIYRTFSTHILGYLYKKRHLQFYHQDNKLSFMSYSSTSGVDLREHRPEHVPLFLQKEECNPLILTETKRLTECELPARRHDFSS